MANLFGVFRTIGHDIEVGAVKVWHLIEVLGHDVDVVFIDTLKALQVLGFTRDQIDHALLQAEQALVMYVEGQQATWSANTVATLQHEFVASSLVEQLGLSAPLAQTLTTIVSKLYATGSSKLEGLIDGARLRAEAAAGLTPAS
jgi:hypothetical protein